MRETICCPWSCGSLIDSLGGDAIKPTSVSSSYIPIHSADTQAGMPPSFSTLLIPRLCLVSSSDAPTGCPKSTAPALSQHAPGREVRPSHASTPSPAQCEIPAAVSLLVYPISMGRSGGVGGPVGATGPLCPSRKLGKTEKHSTRPAKEAAYDGICPSRVTDQARIEAWQRH